MSCVFFSSSDIDVHAQFAVNQSRPEEITMREDLGNITLAGDDGFGNMKIIYLFKNLFELTLETIVLSNLCTDPDAVDLS